MWWAVSCLLSGKSVNKWTSTPPPLTPLPRHFLTNWWYFSYGLFQVLGTSWPQSNIVSKKTFHFPCFQYMLPRLRKLIGLQYRRFVNELSLFKIVKLWKWLLPHEQAISLNSLIWLSRIKAVQKSRFSRIVKNSREKKFEWKHFFSLRTSRKRVKAFLFTLHLLKKSESFFFTFQFSNFKTPLSLVPA